jgi:putative methyltransferase (TIGR04325 family)
MHSALKVRDGEAAYERDSVLFDHVQYAWPVLAGLLRVAAVNDNRIRLLDFGGGLGTSYFQNRHVLSRLAKLGWFVIDQRQFVECGRKHFSTSELKFYYAIEECAGNQEIDVVLLSSVLPYVEKPYDILTQILTLGPQAILVDRTPFLNEDQDRLTVQTASHYCSNIPAWFMSKKRFLNFICQKYEMIFEFEALGGTIDVREPPVRAQNLGFFFERR